jgi:hypothetical protein
LKEPKKKKPRSIKHALRGSRNYKQNKSYLEALINKGSKHNEATKSARDVVEVKPQALDQSNNNPENDSRSLLPVLSMFYILLYERPFP